MWLRTKIRNCTSSIALVSLKITRQLNPTCFTISTTTVANTRDRLGLFGVNLKLWYNNASYLWITSNCRPQFDLLFSPSSFLVYSLPCRLADLLSRSCLFQSYISLFITFGHHSSRDSPRQLLFGEIRKKFLVTFLDISVCPSTCCCAELQKPTQGVAIPSLKVQPNTQSFLLELLGHLKLIIERFESNSQLHNAKREHAIYFAECGCHHRDYRVDTGPKYSIPMDVWR